MANTVKGRTLFKGGTVITVVDGDEPHLADVLVEDGKIVQVGPDLSADAEIIDATDCIVMPGFVDTHRHVWQTQLRGVTHEWSLKDYIRSIRFQSAVHYRPEDMYTGNLLGMLEAVNAGVTTVLDFSHCINTPEHADEAIRGTRESGIRSMFALGLNEVPVSSPAFNSLQHRIDHAKKLRQEQFASNDSLVTMGISLSDVLVAGIERVKKEVAISRELDLRITLHANAVMFPEPVSEVAFLEKENLLGPDLVWVHMNQTTDAELRRVVETGGAISSTPDTEMQMGMGHPVIGRFLAAGGKPTLGCDVISNNSGCLFSQMRLGLQTERMLSNDVELEHHHGPDNIQPSTDVIVKAGTLWGAAAMGLDSKIGTLEPGKDADIIMIRGDDINTMPVIFPYGTVVLHAHPGNVDTVMVAGNILKRDGKLVQNRARLQQLMRDSHRYLKEQVTATGGWIPQPPFALPW